MVDEKGFGIGKKELGKRIKKARAHKSHKIGKRYTGQMLADDVGISRSYLGDIESGRTYPSIELLNKIANALDITASELLEIDDEAIKNNGDFIPYGADELDQEFDRLKSRIGELPAKDKKRIINILKAYLENK